MKTKRLTILIVIAPLLALGAGVAGGVLMSRLPGGAGGASPAGQTQASLTDILELSPDQQEQMRQIWETARSKVHQTVERAQSLQTQRDEALFALLDVEGKVKFAKISKEFSDRDQNLTRERDAAFTDAVQRTKALLSAEQREKYNRILNARVRTDAATLGVASEPASGQ